jgi:DNA-binding beta-propeller fold protein YncE
MGTLDTTTLRRAITTATSAASLIAAGYRGTPIGLQAEARSDTGADPVAISIATNDVAYVLLNDGHVVSFETRTGKVEPSLFVIGRPFIAVDLVVAGGQHDLFLCVPVITRVGQSYRGWLLQWSKTKGEVWSWLPTSGVYTGVAIDEASGGLYVVNGSTSEIFRVSVGKNDARYAGSLQGVERAGPIAMNPDGTALIVGDVSTGSLHRFEVATRVSARISSLPGADVRAIAVDRRKNVFYVADGAGEAIWSLALTSLKEPVRAFSKWKAFEDPSGVAVDSGGVVWITDEKARRVFRLNADGASAGIPVKW